MPSSTGPSRPRGSLPELPRFISVDDHVVEPPDLWVSRLPARYQDAAPKVVRRKGRIEVRPGRPHQLAEDEDGTWGDCWVYGDVSWPLTPSFAAVGIAKADLTHRPLTYDDIRAGCYAQRARLADMDENNTEASICFPTFPRFCGQTFLERGDRDLSLLCLQAYNDWMIDEWCGGAGRGRLIPLTLIPLWDVQLAADEVRRCAAKGSHAIAFSENPTALGLPSVHGEYWDPLWHACEDTETVVNMHIGSSSKLATTGPGAPQLVTVTLTFQGAMHAAVDWLLSGVFERFPGIRAVLSEGQVGWLPFILERLDNAWEHAFAYGGVADRVTSPPSSYVPGHLFGCIFDDLAGLELRTSIGMSQIMFETDYPHGDSTWPDSATVAADLVAKAGLSPRETVQLVRQNAIDCFQLGRFGIG